MTQKVNHDGDSDANETFPEWCKDAAEKVARCGPVMEKMMAHCGPMMEKMMARFGARPTESPCDGNDTRK